MCVWGGGGGEWRGEKFSLVCVVYLVGKSLCDVLPIVMKNIAELFSVLSFWECRCFCTRSTTITQLLLIGPPQTSFGATIEFDRVRYLCVYGSLSESCFPPEIYLRSVNHP